MTREEFVEITAEKMNKTISELEEEWAEDGTEVIELPPEKDRFGRGWTLFNKKWKY